MGASTKARGQCQMFSFFYLSFWQRFFTEPRLLLCRSTGWPVGSWVCPSVPTYTRGTDALCHAQSHHGCQGLVLVWQHSNRLATSSLTTTEPTALLAWRWSCFSRCWTILRQKGSSATDGTAQHSVSLRTVLIKNFPLSRLLANTTTAVYPIASFSLIFFPYSSEAVWLSWPASVSMHMSIIEKKNLSICVSAAMV